MADTYIDVRSASLNRWSLRQAQYILSRQRFAALLGAPVHFPKLDGGYAFSGHYDDFFTQSGEEETTVENLRKATFEESKRAGRLAEVAVDGISGLSEVLSGQIASLSEMLATSERLRRETMEQSAETQRLMQEQLAELMQKRSS